MDRISPSVAVLAFCCALGACVVDLDSPGGVIQCSTDNECPEGLACAEALGQCVAGTLGDGPEVVSVEISPNPAASTSAITVNLVLDEPSGRVPDLVLDTSPERVFQTLTEFSTGDTEFRFSLSEGSLPGGDWDVVGNFFGEESGVSVDVNLGRLTVDTSAPSLAAPPLASSAIVGASSPFSITLSFDEEIAPGPSADLIDTSEQILPLAVTMLDGRTLQVEHDGTTSLADGFADLSIEVSDLAGNVSQFTAGSVLQVDATGPIILPEITSVRLVPLAGNPQSELTAIGANATVDVIFAVDEAISGTPDMTAVGPGPFVAPTLVFSAGTTFQYRFTVDETVELDSLTSGQYTLRLTVTDLYGNESISELPTGFAVDLIPPEAPDVSQERIVHLRDPWGSDDSSGQPTQSLVMSAEAVQLGTEDTLPTLVVFDRAEIATAVELARIVPTGAPQTESLPPLDRAEIFVATLDGAGNYSGPDPSTALRIRFGEWVASLGSKVAGLNSPNPHRVNRTLGRAGRLTAREPSDYAPLAQADGVGVAFEPLTDSETLARANGAPSFGTPRQLLFLADRDAFVLQVFD
ncbi:MAG: hypothetical protein AAFQ82_11015, partial [Myxococcota bacterium]